MANNQLIEVSNYDVNRIIFSEPVRGSVPDSPIEYQRINISTRNEDGSVGDLILPTGKLFSFGVSENVNPETQKVNGWTLPLCLWNRDGPTQEQKEWTTTFDAIVEHCIANLVENPHSIEKLFDVQESEYRKAQGGLNPLYWQREVVTENGKKVRRIVPGTGPTLYPKLIYSKKNEKFVSQFFDPSDTPLNPLDLIGKYCYVNAAIKIESIFIGSRICLQVKVYEAVVEVAQTGMKRLLARPTVMKSKLLGEGVATHVPPPPAAQATFSATQADDTGSLNGDDSDGDSKPSAQVTVQTPPQEESKTNVRKVVKKIIKRA
jgi:hypothetical protein